MKLVISILIAVGFFLAGGLAYNFIHELVPEPPIFGALGALVVWIVGWIVVSRRNK